MNEACDVRGCRDTNIELTLRVGERVLRLCRRHWRQSCGPDGNGDRPLPLKRGTWPAPEMAEIAATVSLMTR